MLTTFEMQSTFNSFNL